MFYDLKKHIMGTVLVIPEKYRTFEIGVVLIYLVLSNEKDLEDFA